ncbi:cupin domain-containing protein [Granulosicoccus antarcticus]|uniref:cupin domain-containing protein n=1 Tax=Granulosicoccus antarcticus TaxID=437505 RepID=UPI003AAC73C2
MSGDAIFRIDSKTHKAKAGSGIVVPAGTHHNVICTGHHALKLYTICGPPHHRDQLIQKTEVEAEASEEAFEGQTTEPRAEVVRLWHLVLVLFLMEIRSSL